VAKNDLLTRERAIALFDYDPVEGNLRWRRRTPDMFDDGIYSAERRCQTWNARFAGEIAGSISGYGYRQIELPDGFPCLAHRIIWLIVYGRWPEDQIDHRNGIGIDNRLSNLREATQLQNQQNRKDRSRHVGASWHQKEQRWQARITVGRQQKALGYFDTAEEAHQAYLDAKAQLHTFNPTLRAA
jgi:hypothetical protein